MRLTYDPSQNVAYIHLREQTAEVETIHLSDELKIDIAPDGTVYGIELLNANEQLGKTLIVENNGGTPTHVELRKVG